MNDWRKHLDPEDMTPEERLRRVVDLLATASIRLATGEKVPAELNAKDKEATIPASGAQSQKIVREIGRVPFGQKVTERGRAVDATELKWIKRIRELVAEGLSMENIAKRLNAEDHETRRQGKWCGSTVWRLLRRESKKGIAD